MNRPPKFKPQLKKVEAILLAKKYIDADEKDAFEAGAAIRKGRASVVHLNTIYKWKTGGRGKGRLLDNSPSEICEALSIAANAEHPRSAIAVLSGLYGVNTPVASAIATVIHPERYTVIDFRALISLGHDTVDNSIPFYLAYLDYCKSLAAKWQMPLRDLDRALWQWSKNQG